MSYAHHGILGTPPRGSDGGGGGGGASLFNGAQEYVSHTTSASFIHLCRAYIQSVRLATSKPRCMMLFDVPPVFWADVCALWCKPMTSNQRQAQPEEADLNLPPPGAPMG